LTDHPKSKILFASVAENPRIKYTIKIKGKPMTGELSLGDFMDVKGWKAVGNKLSDQALSAVKEIAPIEVPKVEPVVAATPAAAVPMEIQQGSLFGDFDAAPPAAKPVVEKKKGDSFKPGDTIEFD
jgi:topoisomerase-4 subunit A